MEADLMKADWRELILDSGAIGAGIAIGEAQHGAILGMQHVKLHAIGQIDIGGNQAKTVGFIAACGLDVGNAAGSSFSNLSVMISLQS